MQIRPLVLTDLPDLRRGYAAFLIEQREKCPGAYPVFDTEELDNFVVTVVRGFQSHQFAIWVAEAAGQQFVGFCGAEIIERPVSKPHRYGYVDWLWVDPTCRQQGVGKALAAACMRWYAAAGIDAIEIHAVAGDPQWERRGWTVLRTHLMNPRLKIEAWAAAPVAHDGPPETPPPPKRKRGRPRKQPQVNGHDDAR
jgi:ribosomal protein S18 acetylase RimI-like enzyme